MDAIIKAIGLSVVQTINAGGVTKMLLTPNVTPMSSVSLADANSVIQEVTLGVPRMRRSPSARRTQACAGGVMPMRNVA